MMAAPIGNQFWKNVPYEKLGRPAAYNSPKELWDEVVGYFDECDNNPIEVDKEISSDKGVSQITSKHRIPYTWRGLYVYLGVRDLEHYKTKNEFSEIMKHIGNIIYNQKFTGAAIGIFNHNLIARELGLNDNIVNTNLNHEMPPITEERIKEITDKLNKLY